MKHVLVLGAQVPFVSGGAELLNDSLVSEINKLEGVTAELVNLPFKWYPEEQMLNDIMAWRHLDLSESNGTKIDLVIATKFPTYAAKHDNKVLWLVHQHRTLYDLDGSEMDTWKHKVNSQQVRQEIQRLDNLFFDECKSIYTIANTVSDRLHKYNGVPSVPLFPPPALGDLITKGEYGDYILYVGRLDPMKRVDLLIKALAITPEAKVKIVGKGAELANLKKLLLTLKLEDRCELLGYVEDEELLMLLAGARAIHYSPIDEDYGYATIEAFLAMKPVITCFDSGEVEKMVKKTKSGFICDNNSESISNAMKEIYQLTDNELTVMSMPGYKLAKSIKWDEIMKKLVLDNL